MMVGRKRDVLVIGGVSSCLVEHEGWKGLPVERTDDAPVHWIGISFDRID